MYALDAPTHLLNTKYCFTHKEAHDHATKVLGLNEGQFTIRPVH